MFYKTGKEDHKPSIGILVDMIKKHGAASSEVESYLQRFKDHESFMKKANTLIGLGSIREDVENKENIEKENN